MWQGDWCLCLLFMPYVPSVRVGSQRVHMFTSTLHIVLISWVLFVVNTYITSDKLEHTWDLYLSQWCRTQNLCEASNCTKCQILHSVALMYCVFTQNFPQVQRNNRKEIVDKYEMLYTKTWEWNPTPSRKNLWLCPVCLSKCLQSVTLCAVVLIATLLTYIFLNYGIYSGRFHWKQWSLCQEPPNHIHTVKKFKAGNLHSATAVLLKGTPVVVMV